MVHRFLGTIDWPFIKMALAVLVSLLFWAFLYQLVSKVVCFSLGIGFWLYSHGYLVCEPPAAVPATRLIRLTRAIATEKPHLSPTMGSGVALEVTWALPGPVKLDK